jgi:hypothetical protein
MSPVVKVCTELDEGLTSSGRLRALLSMHRTSAGRFHPGSENVVTQGPIAGSTGMHSLRGEEVWREGSCVWVHTSRSAGLGLFTAQDMRKGTRMLPYIGEKIPKAESTRAIRARQVMTAGEVPCCRDAHRGVRGESLQEPSQAHGREVRWPGAPIGHLPAPGALVVQ